LAAPKAFISYSWSNETHEKRVMQLAEDLRASGVESILDKWHLKDGHDATAFMEKMVHDDEIKKVIIVSDEEYTRKANDRQGGVGTETQIITPEIYSKSEQSKFVLLAFERDKNGEAFVPTYYKSRIYIDMSDPNSEAQSFERLLRWIFDQPLDRPPPVGNTPTYITDKESSVNLSTAPYFKRSIDALKLGKAHAAAATSEYFERLIVDLEKFRADISADPFDDEIINRIEQFLSHRNEFISLIDTISKYMNDTKSVEEVKEFFEKGFEYTQRPKDVGRYRDLDWDNYKFIIHELMLYTVAIFIKNKKYSWANEIINGTYYLKSASSQQYKMQSVSLFRPYCSSIDKIRNRRLNLNRISVHADLLKERCAGLPISFEELKQADFTMYLARMIHAPDGPWMGWYPITAVYMRDYQCSFELFIKSASIKHFKNLCAVLGISTKVQLDTAIEHIYSSSDHLPRADFGRLAVKEVMAYEEIATMS